VYDSSNTLLSPMIVGTKTIDAAAMRHFSIMMVDVVYFQSGHLALILDFIKMELELFNCDPALRTHGRARLLLVNRYVPGRREANWPPRTKDVGLPQKEQSSDYFARAKLTPFPREKEVSACKMLYASYSTLHRARTTYTRTIR
jgi:hypothetical protein